MFNGAQRVLCTSLGTSNNLMSVNEYQSDIKYEAFEFFFNQLPIFNLIPDQ